MKEIVILIILIIGVLFIFFLLWDKKNDENKARTIQKIKPETTVSNDKLILIKNVNQEDVLKAIIKFCQLYNQESYKALPVFYKINSTEFAICFPYDIDFDTFCYFINYLKYPYDINYQADIKAWLTLIPNHARIKSKMADKKAIIYIPIDDNEYDNVYLTTSDNVSFKIGFAIGQSENELDYVPKAYSNPEIELSKLGNYISIDIVNQIEVSNKI